MATLGTFSPLTPLTAAELNAIGTYTAYTPTWTNLTVGNATQTFAYAQLNDMVHVFGRITLGSTSVVGTNPTMTLPVNRDSAYLAVIGTGTLQDVGTGTYLMYPLSNAAGSVIIFRADHTVGSTVIEGSVAANSPFVWTTGDVMQVNFWYRSA